MTVFLTGDVNESEATETVMFGLDGSTYEIDLNDEHAAQLRDAFAPYLDAARLAGRVPTARGGNRSSSRAGTGSSTTSKSERSNRVQEIREWARANGHEVSERGRLSGAVIQAYAAANPS